MNRVLLMPSFLFASLAGRADSSRASTQSYGRMQPPFSRLMLAPGAMLRLAGLVLLPLTLSACCQTEVRLVRTEALLGTSS